MSNKFDGYLVLRKFGTCDAQVLEKLTHPKVEFYFNDLKCADCYRSLEKPYFKDNVPNRKKTFTLGYRYAPRLL